MYVPASFAFAPSSGLLVLAGLFHRLCRRLPGLGPVVALDGILPAETVVLDIIIAANGGHRRRSSGGFARRFGSSFFVAFVIIFVALVTLLVGLVIISLVDVRTIVNLIASLVLIYFDDLFGGQVTEVQFGVDDLDAVIIVVAFVGGLVP